MCHLVVWFSLQGGDESKVGLDDVGGLFQPKWLHDSLMK